MKGRLLIVDDETLEVVKNDFIWGVKIPEFKITEKGSSKVKIKPMWQKTITDIVADMLNICSEDYIILWKISNKKNKKRANF